VACDPSRNGFDAEQGPMVNTKRESLGFVLFASAVTAIGGFLFGYDTAVINGANTFLQQHFGLEPARDAFLIGLATSAAIIGCIPGAMSAGFISDRFGRRSVLFACAILFAASGVLSAIPRTFGQFVGARVLSGVAIGVSSMICPIYIAEIAPPRWRGG
jgi:MFS family permease